MNMSTEVQYGKGLTWRSALALVFGNLIVQPAIIYYYLVTGLYLPLMSWIVILVWSEISRGFGRPLTKQEIFIILSFDSLGLLGYSWAFVNPIRNYYFANSAITKAFGLTPLIPTWWVPPVSLYTEILLARSFMHPAWLIPILTTVVIPITLGLIANIAMGYFSYALYVSVEKLSFPAQTAAAQAVIAVADREPSWIRPLLLAGVVGVLYNLMTSFSLFTVGFAVGRGPVDFTAVVETFLPGASLGFTSDLTYYVVGSLLPMGVAVFQLIGSIAFYFVGNAVITMLNMWPSEFPWKPGLGMTVIAYRSTLYFWTSVFIGLMLAAAFVPIAMNPGKLIKAFKSLAKAGREAGGVPVWILLAMFLLATLGSVALVQYLVPGFPIWLLILFTVGLSFFVTFVQTSAAGVTYGGFNIPYLREMMIYYSGYGGFDIWLAPVQMMTGGSTFTGAFLQADICGTKHSEYVKASFLVVGLGVVMSYIYVSLFMRLADIPSIAYPYTIIKWPVETTEWARWRTWLWTGLLFRSDLIIGSLAVGAALVVGANFLHAPFAPVSLIMGGLIGVVPGVVLGISPIALSFAQFVGAVFSHYGLARVLGKERWGRIRNLVVMGFVIGDSLMNALVAAIMLLSKSMWVLPY